MNLGGEGSEQANSKLTTVQSFPHIEKTISYSDAMPLICQHVQGEEHSKRHYVWKDCESLARDVYFWCPQCLYFTETIEFRIEFRKTDEAC